MKKIILSLIILSANYVSAQITTPALSPSSKVEQTIGLSTVTVDYSRPSKRGRTVFPDVVPYDQVWRAGANKNSIITFSDDVTINQMPLKAGSYALFVKPTSKDWTVYFYTNTNNWGTPANWDENLVALKTTSNVFTVTPIETFTISFDKIEINGADLILAWDNKQVVIPFKVDNSKKIESSIQKTLNGPTANDFYRSADYYYNANGDLKQALTWVNKSIEMSGENAPYYFVQKKALIQAKLGDYSGAIETALKSSEIAKKTGSEDVVKTNDSYIKEWKKKK